MAHGAWVESERDGETATLRVGGHKSSLARGAALWDSAYRPIRRKGAGGSPGRLVKECECRRGTRGGAPFSPN